MGIAPTGSNVELNAVGTGSTSQNKSVTNGTLLIALTSHWFGNGVVTVSDASNGTWATDKTKDGAGGSGAVTISSVQNTVTNAALSITGSAGGVQSFTTMLLEFTGARTSSALDTTGSDSESDTSNPRADNTGIVVASGSLVVAVFTSDRTLSTRSPAPPAGWDYGQISGETLQEGYYMYKVFPSGAAAEKGLLTVSSGIHYAAAIASYKVAAATFLAAANKPILRAVPRASSF